MGHRVRMTVGLKLAVLAGTGVLVASAIGIVTFVSLGTVRSASDLRTVLNKANASLIDLDMQQSNVQIAERDMLLATTETARKAANDKYAGIQRTVDADWSALRSLDLPAEIDSVVTTLHADYDTYLTDVGAEMSALAVIEPASPEAATALQTGAERANAMQEKITGTRDLVQEHVHGARTASDNAMATLKTTIIVALVLGLSALVGISVLIARSITRPLHRMVSALGRVAERDLTTSVAVASSDEIGQMATALTTALTAMRNAVATVGETSSALAGASDELTAVATQLGQAAEETTAQADTVSATAQQVSANVSTMSAATEEMTASITDIAHSASTAAGVATGAVTTAEETSQAVERLGQASVEIGDILR